MAKTDGGTQIEIPPECPALNTEEDHVATIWARDLHGLNPGRPQTMATRISIEHRIA
jgi:hypothetical protein